MYSPTYIGWFTVDGRPIGMLDSDGNAHIPNTTECTAYADIDIPSVGDRLKQVFASLDVTERK